MTSERGRVLTIGHSNLPLSVFLSVIKRSNVTAVADVRSSPFSRRVPHFNKNDLRYSLKEINIDYVFLGKELGGRPTSKKLYQNGIADYEKMAIETSFVEGINRVIEGSKKHSIVLMCSERDPLDCHRCLLVGRALSERNVCLGHILSNGSITSHHDIEERLMKTSFVSTKDLFIEHSKILDEAYKIRSRSVAYRETSVEKVRLEDTSGYDYAG